MMTKLFHFLALTDSIDELVTDAVRIESVTE